MFLRHRHSHNRHDQNVSFIEPEFFVLLSKFFLSLNTNNCLFWKLNNSCWGCNKCFHHNASEVLVESRAYIRSELLTQCNAGCKTLNKDHYDYTYYQRLSAFHVLFLYGWLYQISVSFSHFFPRQISHAVRRNFYMN